MSEVVELRDLGGRLRRRWWIPALLALAGAALGVFVANQVAPVHRAQGTLLVGPISGTVTRSTTLRASESLASFYADLARRQVVLGPVVERLNLPTSWTALRDQVSAVTPDQNPRLVTVTVTDPSKARAHRIAQEIVARLVALSPAPSAASTPAFLSRQVASLQGQIEQAETEIAQLNDEIAQETDAVRQQALRKRQSERQQLLDDWRRTYVELMSVDPTSEAGGITVIDDVTSLTSLDRAGAVRQGVVGGVIGLALGILLVWLTRGFGGRRSAVSSAESNVREPADQVMSTAARQSAIVPKAARSLAHET